MTAAQKLDVSVFVLSTERPCDWGDLAGVGATAAPYPVKAVECREGSRGRAGVGAGSDSLQSHTYWVGGGCRLNSR